MEAPGTRPQDTGHQTSVFSCPREDYILYTLKSNYHSELLWAFKPRHTSHKFLHMYWNSPVQDKPLSFHNLFSSGMFFQGKDAAQCPSNKDQALCRVLCTLEVYLLHRWLRRLHMDNPMPNLTETILANVSMIEASPRLPHKIIHNPSYPAVLAVHQLLLFLNLGDLLVAWCCVAATTKGHCHGTAINFLHAVKKAAAVACLKVIEWDE